MECLALLQASVLSDLDTIDETRHLTLILGDGELLLFKILLPTFSIRISKKTFRELEFDSSIYNKIKQFCCVFL